VAAIPRIALIGAGSMGSNHARVLAETDEAELAIVIDIEVERARQLADLYGCGFATDIGAAASCDAAVVATPTALHLPHARELIDFGKPVLVEKPVTPNIEATRAVITAADRAGTPLMCGFVERFNPVVTTVATLLDREPVHLVTLRHSPKTPRSTLSVVLDLLIHDIDLVLRYMGGKRVHDVVSATASPNSDVAEVADCILRFETGAVATLSASRASQRKVRTHVIETGNALYDVDLLRQDITVYQHRSHEAVYRDGPTYRAETVVDIPFVRHGGEPLALQLRHFLRLIAGAVDAEAERSSILPAHEVAALVEKSA
jgi:predicted dehydrogenase